ncbi:integrase [Streptomyces sp. P9-A2]|uniref:integrase n=1 Tax=Streptomyces sp. P9-A2 TaxID=3072284 RepID=UPI002FC6D00C
MGPQADPRRVGAARAPDRRLDGGGDSPRRGLRPRAASLWLGPGGEFLTARAEGIIAADFFHFDTALGRRLYAPAYLEHGTRRLHITGVTAHPTGEWTVQQARNLAADLGIRRESLRFLLRDRDGKYDKAFDRVFEAEELDVIKSALRAPRMNAYGERVIGSRCREVLDHIPVRGEAHARQVLAAYQRHHHEHRPPRRATGYHPMPRNSPPR